MMERLESRIQRSFVQQLSSWFAERQINGACVKFEGAKGWPDLIITWGRPDGPAQMVWIEFKRPGEVPRPLQLYIHKQLRGMGHDVRVYDNDRLALADIQAVVESTL